MVKLNQEYKEVIAQALAKGHDISDNFTSVDDLLISRCRKKSCDASIIIDMGNVGGSALSVECKDWQKQNLDDIKKLKLNKRSSCKSLHITELFND